MFCAPWKHLSKAQNTGQPWLTSTLLLISVALSRISKLCLQSLHSFAQFAQFLEQSINKAITPHFLTNGVQQCQQKGILCSTGWFFPSPSQAIISCWCSPRQALHPQLPANESKTKAALNQTHIWPCIKAVPWPALILPQINKIKQVPGLQLAHFILSSRQTELQPC